MKHSRDVENVIRSDQSEAMHEDIATRQPLEKRASYAWVTNVAAPYRRPVWDHIARNADLTVYLLESNSRLRKKPSNRGAEWRASDEFGYKTIEVPTWRFSRRELTLYAAHRRFLHRSHDAVVIAGWESPAYWQALLTARRWKIPTVGFYESTLRSNRFKSGPVAVARRRFFHFLDAIVVPGPAARDAVLNLGIASQKIHVGFNSVDVTAIHRGANRWRSSRPAGDRSAGHHFIFVGRLIELKNLKILLHAFATIRNADDRLTIVGKGPELHPLQELAVELGIDDRVDFPGLVPYDAIAPVLAAAHTLVLPSTQEVWGLVANEALAAGLQCVVSDACGVSESVASMRGVFVTDTSIGGIGEGMARARADWRGPLQDPEILEHTPQQFGNVFLRALRSTGRSPS